MLLNYADSGYLQIDKHKTFQDEVVEDKVNIVIFFFGVDPLLTGYKSIAFPKLHKELLQISQDSGLSDFPDTVWKISGNIL